jgi:cyclohexyl-isocyanide hydratase
VFAAGVTAGIDGALRPAAELRGDEAAQMIQLYIEYAPEPPFNSGTPETAPAAIVAQVRQAMAGIFATKRGDYPTCRDPVRHLMAPQRR